MRRSPTRTRATEPFGKITRGIIAASSGADQAEQYRERKPRGSALDHRPASRALYPLAAARGTALIELTSE